MFGWLADILEKWAAEDKRLAAEKDARFHTMALGHLAGIALAKGPDSWEWKGLWALLEKEKREGKP